MPLAEFTQRMTQTIHEIRAAPKSKAAKYICRAMEWTRRARALREGIDMPEDVPQAYGHWLERWDSMSPASRCDTRGVAVMNLAATRAPTHPSAKVPRE